ncbi:MAG: TIM barrel protein [Spirochaetes bacterium]|nr:TIM barrel protein [Spirochaetota bacterium]
MKTSLSTFVYYRYPLAEAIRRTAAFGFDAVELWGGRPHAYCDDMTGARIAAVRETIEECGIAVSNFIPAQFRYPSNLAAGDEDIRRTSVDYIRRSIDVAAALGSPLVSLCPGYTLYGQSARAGWEAMMQSFRELLAHAEGMPLRLLLEPGNRYETDLVVTVDDGLRALDELGVAMGILVDTGHCYMNRESLSDVVEKVGGRRCHYHIDDNGGVTDDHLVMGEGVIDFEVFLDRLATSGYDGYLAVELGFGYTVDPDPAVRRSIEFFRRRFGR